jgi:hypothetical protein
MSVISTHIESVKNDLAALSNVAVVMAAFVDSPCTLLISVVTRKPENYTFNLIKLTLALTRIKILTMARKLNTFVIKSVLY